MQKLIGLVVFILCSSVAALAADQGGLAAFNRAIGQIGEAGLRGNSSDGQPCDLSFDNTPGSAFLGNSVFGSYTLTVNGVTNTAPQFSFIESTSFEETDNGEKFVTSVRVGSDDSPDEGGFHRGFTAAESLEISTANSLLTVTIKNGDTVTCSFTVQ